MVYGSTVEYGSTLVYGSTVKYGGTVEYGSIVLSMAVQWSMAVPWTHIAIPLNLIGCAVNPLTPGPKITNKYVIINMQ